MNKRNTNSGRGPSGRKYTGKKDGFRTDNDRRDSDRSQKEDRKDKGSERKDFGSRKPRGESTRGGDEGEKRSYSKRETPERRSRAGENKRPYNREERPERKGRGDSDRKPFNRDERPERRSRDGENKRPYNREERPERRGRGDSDRKPFSRDDRPERRSRDGESKRPFNRDERPERRGNEGRSEFRPREEKYSGPKRRDDGGDRRDDNRGGFPRKREGFKKEGSERSGRPFGERGDKKGFNKDRKPYSSGKRDFDRKDKPSSFERPDKRRTDENDEKRRPKTKKFNKNDQELIGNWRDERPATERPTRDKGEVQKITGEVRLNKYLANSGLCSRRDADAFIENGSVSVNGEVVKELGVKVRPGDEVRFKGRLVLPEKSVYILMNKPKDCITSADDPDGRRTVLDLLDESIEERVFPVGRLDRNTTGVLLITNDGDLAQKLTHPSYGVHKVYKAELDKPLNMDDMEKLAAGIELEDGFIQPDSIAYIDETRQSIGIEIHSGKNHIVHRMFNHFGYLVDKLDRVSFAGLTKDRIKRGEYRMLTEKEVLTLRRASGKKKE